MPRMYSGDDQIISDKDCTCVIDSFCYVEHTVTENMYREVEFTTLLP